MLVPEERRAQGLLLRRPIFENVTLSHLLRYARAGLFLDRRREHAVTATLGRRLGLRSASLRQPVGQLSGGNQQKVVFARGLAGEAQVLMLDEPTRGIDIGAKQELYQLIRQLSGQGAGILLVSSELPELLGLADRLLVLHEGRQTALLDAGEVDEETVLRYCYGLQRPNA
jgi:ribose transport system ATP-binding protein